MAGSAHREAAADAEVLTGHEGCFVPRRGTRTLSLSLPIPLPVLPGKRRGKREVIKQWMSCDEKMNVLPLEAEGPLPPGALKRSG